MADSFIQLSPDSTGKKVDTRTAPDGDHREVQVIGSPTTADVAEADATFGLDVDVTRSVLPIGAATAANQLPNSHDVTVDNAAGAAAVNIQDGGNSITIDGAVSVSGAVDTELPAAAALADNTANPTAPAVGAFGQVWDGATWDRAPGNSADGALVNLGANNDVSLNAGTNNIGDVDVLTLPALSAGTNNIGDVDIASLPNEGQQTMANSISVAIASDQSTVPVSLAAGGTTQYAEDTAHVTGDLVTMAGVVQQSADAALSTDGDRSLLQVDASGFLKVNIKAGAGSGGTAMADDAAFTPAVTQGTPAFAFADETAPDSVDEGDAGALRMTLDRKLLTRVVGASDANRLDVDASGHAQIDIAAASVTVPISAASLPLPTGASTSANQTTEIASLAAIESDADAIRVATELIDDTVKVLGTDTYTEATTKGLVVGAVRRDADTSPVNLDNEIGPLSMDANGRLKVEAFSGETLPVSLASTTITGTVTVDSELPAAAALADATANPTTPLVAAALETFNGTTWDRARGDTTNGLDVDVTRLPALVAGTANIGDVDVLTLPSIPAGTNNIGDVDVLTMPVTEVVGDVAADAAVPANPVAIGGRASTAVPTAVSADGDSVYQWLNRNGLAVVSGIPGAGLNADPYTLLSETAQYTTTQTSTVLVAGGASERIVVTSIQIQVGGTTAGTLQVYFGIGAYARGTDEAIFDGEFAPSATLKPGFFAAPPAGFRAGALGDDILVTTSAAINPLTITVWYYILGV